MRKDFCSFLLSVCPCLREYGNISYNKQNSNLNSRHGSQNVIDSDQVSNNTNPVSDDDNTKYQVNHSNQKKIMLPIMTLESPD